MSTLQHLLLSIPIGVGLIIVWTLVFVFALGELIEEWWSGILFLVCWVLKIEPDYG